MISLTGEGIGVTSSVLTGIAHKDDITSDQIRIVQEKSDLLLKQTLKYIKG